MSVALYREDGLASSTAIKGPCRVATTANIALEGEQTIDGIAVVEGNRVLVKNQTNAVENGIYIADTGNWRRSADFEGNRDVRKGTKVAVTDGTANENTVWVVTTSNPVVVDTASITFDSDPSTAAAISAAADAAQTALDKIAAEAAQAAAEVAQSAAEAALASINAALAGQVGKIDWFASNDIALPWLEADGSAVSRTTYSALFAKLVTNSGYSAQTFTVTIATPAVITKTGHGFLGGERVRLSTTSALPSGLDTTTDYYVKYVNANTFQVSTTFGGASINTTGTQAGTHTYLQNLWGLGDGSTTFNLPLVNDDDRLVAPAGTGRAIGTPRAESVGPHGHTATSTFTGSALPAHAHAIQSADEDDNSPSGPTAGNNNKGNESPISTAAVSAGTPAGTVATTVNNNSGTINLPPTIALLACVYTGVAA